MGIELPKESWKSSWEITGPVFKNPKAQYTGQCDTDKRDKNQRGCRSGNWPGYVRSFDFILKLCYHGNEKTSF